MKLDTKVIRARCDRATKGPWLIIVEALRPRVNCERVSGFDDETVCTFEVRDPPDQNADFIAAARTDVPALCSRVEALECALRVIRASARRLVIGDGSATSAGDHLTMTITLEGIVACAAGALEGE
jgi:hypothetical protein